MTQSTGPSHAEWDLRGVSCADCARKAADEVRRLPGVVDADIRVMASQLVLDYDPDALHLDSVRKALATEGIRLAAGEEAGRETPGEMEGTHAAAHHHGIPSFDGSSWVSSRALRTYASGIAFLVGMALHVLTGDPDVFTITHWVLPVSGVAFLVAAAIGGMNFLPSGIRALTRLRLDMHFLMSVAIVGAVIISEFVEAAAIAVLFSFAELLEDHSVDRARNSLRELMTMAPETARVRTDGGMQEMPSVAVGVGAIVVVRAGERIPVDGIIHKGEGCLDQSPVTGESFPVDKEVGETVYAGTVLDDGYLEVETTRAYSESTLQRIVKLVQEAESSRAPAEQFVDRFARWYTPSVVLLALLLSTVPPILLGGAFDVWFLRGLTLLVIACPCALVISTPVSVVSALTAGARRGVLIKGGAHLEALRDVRIIAFDKTGTLTEGRPRLTEVRPINGMDSDQALRIAAALEANSAHPVATAVIDAWRESTGGDVADLPEVDDFSLLTGLGVKGTVEEVAYRLGRPTLFEVDEQLDLAISGLTEQGQTVAVLGPDHGSPVAVIGFADTARAEASATISELRALGIDQIAMLTGDNARTADAVGRQLNVDLVFPALLPDEKMDIIEQLQSEYGRVAMVGDGVNDAPALARADVGIAMGAAGSDTAIETCDVALMADDLSRLPYAVKLSRKAGRVIRQNITASLGLKLALALGVIPGAVTLITAVLVGDMGASLAVTLNAMRLASTSPGSTDPPE
jgi:Cd2+/Zn2+-exporting ATPase